MNKQTRQGCTTQSINLGDLVKKPEVLPDDSKIKNIGSICSIRKITPVELVEDNKLSDELLNNLEKLKKAREYNDILKGAKLGLSAYQKPKDGIPKIDLSLDLQLTLDEIDIIKEESKSSKAFGSVSYNEVTNKIYFYSVNDIKLNSPVGVVKLPKFSKSTGDGAQADWNATVGSGVILNKPDIYTKAEVDNIVSNLDTITILYVSNEFGEEEDNYIFYKENPYILLELPELYSNAEVFNILKNSKDCSIVVNLNGGIYLYLLSAVEYYEEEMGNDVYSREVYAAFTNIVSGREYCIEITIHNESTLEQYFANYDVTFFKVSPKNVFYAQCTTSNTTKLIQTDSDFQYLVPGTIINIYFKYGLGSSTSLNINNTGSKPIYYKSNTIVNPGTIVKAGDIATFIFHNGKYYLLNVDGHINETPDALLNVETNEDGTLTFYKGPNDTITVDLNHTHPQYVNRNSLSEVAFSGSYNDLSDIPSFQTVTEQEKNTWNSKADKIQLVNVESTGDVSLLLDPNKFYKFGSIDSLSITLSPSLDFSIYAGKFTTSSNWGGDGFNLSSSVTRSPISDEIVAEQSYEFSIFDNVCIVKLID